MKFKLLLLLPLILSACSAGTNTPVPTRVTSPSPAPATSTPVPQPTVTLASSGRYFMLDFKKSVADWSTFVTSGEAGLFDLRVEDGAWVFDLGGKDLHTFALYQPETYKNVRVDVRVENREDDANSLTLICRYNEEAGWYQYEIFNSGVYNLYYVVWDEDMKAVPTLLTGGVSENVHRGQDTNEIGMACNDRDLVLYVNGQQAYSYRENQYLLRDGQVGVGVSSYDHLPVRLDFDWLKISLP